MNEIIPILQNNFLTKNLGEDEISKLATAMKIQTYKRKERIITYGDSGTHYFILSKGSVQVIVYKPGTNPNDPDIDNKKILIKYMN